MLYGLRRGFHKEHYKVPLLLYNRVFVLSPKNQNKWLKPCHCCQWWNPRPTWLSCRGVVWERISTMPAFLLTALLLMYPNPRADFKEKIIKIFILVMQSHNSQVPYIIFKINMHIIWNDKELKDLPWINVSSLML